MSQSDPQLDAKVRLIADAALGRKAEDLVILDMHEVSSFADRFVLLTGRSDRQVRAIADGIRRALRASGEKPLGVEGLESSHWALIDAGDVIIHVFDLETREEYAHDRLWSDAPRVDPVALGIDLEPETESPPGVRVVVHEESR
jgi:ribosome-associated protein